MIPVSSRGYAAALLLAASVLAAFWPVLGNDFTNYDDPKYVTANPYVQRGLSAEGARWAWTATRASNWHPLTWMSHMLDWSLFGPDPRGHHLTSLLLHLASTLLLFVVFLQMTGALVRSFVVAFLFGVHPLHVESVAWIAERKDVLSTLFLMLTLLAYVGWTRRPGAGRYALVALALAAGLCAKPMLVSVPLVLLLLDVWPLRRCMDRSAWELVKEKLPLVPLVAASSVVTFLVQRGGGAVGSLESIPLGERLANALVAYAVYVRQTVWPVDLAVFYPHPGDSLPSWQVAVSALLLGAISYAALRLRARAPYLIAGWSWYVVTLIPVIGIVQVGVQAHADRYTYVPLIGLFWMVAWGLPDLARATVGSSGSVRLALRLSILLIPAMVLLTRAQVGTWRDSETLFTHALTVAESTVAHNNLGLALSERGAFDEAIEHYEQAVRIDPDHASSRANLGLALAGKGRHEEALAHYREGLRLDPDEPRAYNNLGLSLAALRRTDEAVDAYRRAIELDPRYATAYSNLAIAYFSAGRLEAAVDAYRRSLAIDPRLPEAHNNLGLALMQAGKPEEAARHFSEAVRLRPDYGRAHVNLAAALYTAGDHDNAARHLDRARRLGVEPPPALVRGLASSK